MNRVLEVAVPLAVTAGVGIGFYFFKKTDEKEDGKRRNSQQSEKRRKSQPDLLSDLPGSGRASEGQITAEDIEEVKSDLLIQSDNGNSIASQFSVISDGDLDRNDLEEDQVDTSISFPDEFQSLVFVAAEEGQGDAPRRQDEFGASISSVRGLTSQLSVISVSSSVSDIEQIDDSNNSSGSGSRNGDRRNGGTGIVTQKTGATPSTDMLYVSEGTDGLMEGASGNMEDILQSVSDLEEEERDEIHDILILHADDDRSQAIQFSQDLKTSIDVENLNTVIFEEFAPDIQSKFRTMRVVFERCRYLFVYVTENFTEADLQRYQNEMALMDSISNPKKSERVIPVWTCENADRILPELAILIGVNFRAGVMDETFKNAVKKLILHGRRTHLTS